MSLIDAFNDHPQRNGQSYAQHLAQSMLYSLLSVIACVIFAIHAIFPFTFEETGGNIIRTIYQKIYIQGASQKVDDSKSF